jgi:vitamin K-dependent gamma-carboxylase
MSTRLSQLLFKPVDIAFLVYLRLLVGGMLAGELINQFFTGDYLTYIEPSFHFTYQFFSFIDTFPPVGMYLLFAIIILSALMVMLGWKYRMATALLFLGSTTLFLMEKAEYVNHAYLYCLVAFMLMWMPANAAFSIDLNRKPSILRTAVPNWMFLLPVFQIAVVYGYAGIAKLHSDWFQAMALKQWVGNDDYFLFSRFISSEQMPWLMSYGGLLFDLLIVPALLWKKSRTLAFAVACVFHLSNVVIFGLATFPWFSVGITALFFGPSWARKLPILKNRLPDYKVGLVGFQRPSNQYAIGALLGVYVLFQLLLPFRHHLYPGSPNWSEEGHRFSWHMMLRSKYASTSFKIMADHQLFYDEGTAHLNATQLRKMGGDPDMILEFAHYLKAVYLSKGYAQVEVYAQSFVSLNGRPMQLLIDPTVDLAKEKRSLCRYKWIEPLED